MNDEPHAFTISSGEFSPAPRPRRRLPALPTSLVVAAMLVTAYDLGLLALGL